MAHSSIAPAARAPLPLPPVTTSAPPRRPEGLARADAARSGRPSAGELRLARESAACGIEALHRIYEGRDPDSPARAMNAGRPVGLAVAHDLAASFRSFLTGPSGRAPSFANDAVAARPNAHGTFTAGNAVAYSFQEMKPSPDGRRHLFVTVGGLTSGTSVGASTPARALANLGHSGPQVAAIAKQSFGADHEMLEFGDALGNWLCGLRRKDPTFDVTVQGHSLGATAAGRAFQTCVENDQAVKANLYNPAPLSVPAHPEAFERGVARLGGEHNLRKLVATFKSDRDPVEVVQHLPGARHLLRASGVAWDLDRVSTVYRCEDDEMSGLQQHNHPARAIVRALDRPAPGPKGGAGSMGQALVSRIAQANRLR